MNKDKVDGLKKQLLVMRILFFVLIVVFAVTAFSDLSFNNNKRSTNQQGEGLKEELVELQTREKIKNCIDSGPSNLKEASEVYRVAYKCVSPNIVFPEESSR